MATWYEDAKNFELYLVQHSKTKLYWNGKGFEEKNKDKSILCPVRLAKSLKHEHVDVEMKLVLADWRDDKTWAHLVPKASKK